MKISANLRQWFRRKTFEGDPNQVTLTSIYIFFIETAKPPPGAMCNFIIDREVTFFFEIA